MESQHIKSVNTDERSKKRLRFKSSNQRAANATANVYRSYKRKIGVTTAASREERVHNPPIVLKRRRRTLVGDGEGTRQAVVDQRKLSDAVGILDKEDDDHEIESGDGLSNFASELDIALDRNGSEVFSKFHRKIWPLVRSLPEILHHAPKIIDLLIGFMLSEEEESQSSTTESSSLTSTASPPSTKEQQRTRYVVNHATTDILHLLGVLARDLRHEIHPYLHKAIIPRIVTDLLNPPGYPPDSGRQPIPLDVTVVEASFRTLSYIFRYDMDLLLTEVEQEGQEPCLERMRQYYGTTLAHRRDLVRRLAAETFSSLIRKLKTESAKKRHLRRVLRALAASAQQQSVVSPNVKRMQADAVDGISLLFIEMARGISGHLHSKANLVVNCVLDSCIGGDKGGVAKGNPQGQELVYSVSSAFFDFFCQHLDSPSAVVLVSKAVKVSRRLTIAIREPGHSSKNAGSNKDGLNSSLLYSIRLVNHIVSYRNGLLLQNDEQIVEDLSGLLELLMGTCLFSRFSPETQAITMSLLCSTWKSLPDRSDFATNMKGLIHDVLKGYDHDRYTQTDGTAAIDEVRSPAAILTEDLLPYLPVDAAMASVGSVILSAAAKIVENYPTVAMTLVHTVASTRIVVGSDLTDDAGDDDDCLFYLEHAARCELTPVERDQLLDGFLFNTEPTDLTHRINSVVAAVKCVSFLTLAGNNSNGNKGLKLLFKKVSNWILELLKCIWRDNTYKSGGSKSTGINLVFSVALESLARLSIAYLDATKDSSLIERNLTEARLLAEKHLLRNPNSLWTLKSVAVFVDLLEKLGLALDGDSNVVFEALMPALRDQYHFRRLHALRILSSYPQRPFRVDHADLDLTDDLEEEPSAHLTTKPEAVGPSGLCNIIATLFAIESSPVNIGNERHLLSLLSRVEVLGRTGRLPVVYAEAAVCHSLGLLHVKFAPIWPAAVKALVALATGHENCAWLPVQEKIGELMRNIPYIKEDTTKSKENDEPFRRNALLHPSGYHDLCVNWELSGGSDLMLFGDRAHAAGRHGRVSRHQSTDEATVLDSLWSVVEGVPHLLTRHSRVIVPIVLAFVQSQYFAINPQDVDARELKLSEHIGDDYHLSSPSGPVDRRVVQRRLTSILKAFSVVNGPQQVYKQRIIFSIFSALTGHQDATIARLALSCIFKFKPAYLMPYSDNIKMFLSKGKLREALLQFKFTIESGVIDQDHRQFLIPMISRILFGRLSTSASNGKSSKDSPASRRTAVLSFLSTLCESDNELYSFIYLMIRCYIPTDCTLTPAEYQELSDQTFLLKKLGGVLPKDCTQQPIVVHQGFLNMLDAVISQLGHRIERYIPVFMSIILALCKAYEVKAEGETASTKELKPDHCGDKSRFTRVGYGAVRSLCYRRLAGIFTQFSERVDFSSYSSRLWSTLEHSLPLLPEMVMNTEKVPSLLLLMETLSSTPKLIYFLSQSDEAVRSVLACLSDTSRSAIVYSTLNFIDNLLSDDGTAPSSSGLGRRLVQRHVGLLLQQFKLRLGLKGGLKQQKQSEITKHVPDTSVSWRRELGILSRVSDFLNEPSEEDTCVRVDLVANLCSLLLPFLDFRRGTDADKLNVLGILEALVPKLPSDAVLFYYSALSGYLFARKANSAITSREVRKALTSVLFTLASASYPEAIHTCRILGNVCATHPKRVDEINYDSAVPALKDLSKQIGDSSWLRLCESKERTDPEILLPLVHSCFHLFFDDDGVISRSAFGAIKCLVALAADQSKMVANNTQASQVDSETAKSWMKLLEGCIMPNARSGLSARDSTARRYFVLTLSEIVKNSQHSSSPTLYGDLACLIRDDDHDLDFFINITHVQIHRRARALQRLRKLLVIDETEIQKINFNAQSISNILLPLAMHPIYESKTKLEENFALEAIATIGAMSYHLSWSKYNSTLRTVLTQFHRHPDQERFLISLICAIIDGFHFDVEVQNGESGNGNDDRNNNPVWRTLENRLIPGVESLLTKEKVNRDGTKVKILRSSVILALLKLFKKLPSEMFAAKLPGLLARICDALRSKESDARDVARSTLAKMVVEIDMVFLADVVRELAITLSEGYRLHVRSATIHSILVELSAVYKPFEPLGDEQELPAFDKTVPALMDLALQDLFGEAQERKEASVRYVKEAGGAKSMNSLELISSMILFKPSWVKADRISTSSAIHVVVSPLLERLRIPGVTTKDVRCIKECLVRVVSGLTRNPSVRMNEVLPFVHATISSFVDREEVEFVMEMMVDDCSSDDEDALQAIEVSGGPATKKSGHAGTVKNNSTVIEWRPSTIGFSKTQKAARENKKRGEQEARRVRDGANAPKLTGSSRYSRKLSKAGMNSPANVSAVVFGLRLLNSSLKSKSKLFDEDRDKVIALLDPFVPLLATCVCRSRDSEIVLLSLKALGTSVVAELPSLSNCTKSLATKTLELLTSSGSASTLNQELMQASFKMLTFLMNVDRQQLNQHGHLIGKRAVETGHNAMAEGDALPLDADQMQVLISFLQASIVESDQHSPAIGMVKAIMSRRFVSAEFYDLMEAILEQSVRSPNSQFSGIFVNYLLNYPMTEDRLEQHIKQIILNLDYEYSEGRLAAIALMTAVAEKLPTQVLEHNSKTFFLPLTMQLVNDESNNCREATAKCLSKFLERLSMDALLCLYGFLGRWLEKDGTLRRTSLQLYGIFLDTRIDLFQRGNIASQLLDNIERVLLQEIKGDWEVSYFSLLCLEKIFTLFSNLLVERTELWLTVTSSLKNDHPWIKLASSRLLSKHLQSLNPTTFRDDGSKSFLLQSPGSLFQVTRNFCYQLNSEEENQSDEITSLAVKSLTWTLQAMHCFPNLCISEEDKLEGKGRDPILWVMTRLSNVAKQKGWKRRQAVYKCFAAFASFCGNFVFAHLDLMLEALYRSETQTQNELDLSSLSNKASLPHDSRIQEESILAKDVIHLLEERCESQEQFLQAFAKTKTRAQEKKERRKILLQTEVVQDPQAAAKRRIEKQRKEKARRKRRVDERKRDRGAHNKRRK